MASPWREDGDASHAASVDTSTQVAQSYGHGRRQLPVNAGPADQYTYEEIAQKLNLPKQELARQNWSARLYRLIKCCLYQPSTLLNQPAWHRQAWRCRALRLSPLSREQIRETH